MLTSRALVALTPALFLFIACSTTEGDPSADNLPEGPCADGRKNANETGVDCGGACARRCDVLQGCVSNDDCASGLVCAKNVCAAETSIDGTKNGDETDVDCGGPAAPPCEVDKSCNTGTDCKDKICTSGRCAAPSPTDNLKNGDESDVDCGGAIAKACGDGKSCLKPSDCASKVCNDELCIPATTTDQVQNGNETDVDCGGGAPAQLCADGKKCSDGLRDCTSKVCKGDVCQAPTGTDGAQNGDETDLDCGGTTTGAKRCPATKTCIVDDDCASNGCAFDKKCAAGRSCTRQLGGTTCGVGEIGAAGAAHESCCTRAPLAGRPTKMDKFFVTAGRMRAFIDRLNGDVRTFARTTTGWKPGWDALVPSTIAEANSILGSYFLGAPNDTDGANSKRSCESGGFGGHTYWTPRNGTDYSDFDQAQLDPKALNCVGWHLARAFCSWEGGRLPTRAEVVNAFQNGGATSYPWGSGSYNPDNQDPRLNHKFNYGYPNVPGRRLLSGGDAADIAWHISPPGRFPLGKNNNGIEIAGNLLHWVNDGEYIFNWTLSWESHGGNLNNQNWKEAWPGEPNGYYAIGFRCVYD